ncbi:MAG: hypothetical protein FJX00_00735 [Alphaproteobacteria bacterium]|nr:hypothetical protein [Alphaproteobacteria bacterium]
MAFFQKNIGNFLDRLAVFFIFSSIRFNRWGRRPWALNTKAWGHIHSLFPGKHQEQPDNRQHDKQMHNGVPEESVQEPWPSFSWPIIAPGADVNHGEDLNQWNRSCIVPTQQGFFGADDAPQVCSNQGKTRPFGAKHIQCFGCAQVCGDQTPVDDRPWIGTGEQGCVFGILRDQSHCICGVLLQKSLRTSWYL